MRSILPIRAAATIGLCGALLLGGAAAASAHVRVTPSTTEAGSFSVLTFRVPNEEATASTTQLTVTLPQQDPFLSVSVQPVPGWKATLHTATLPHPVAHDGATVTEAVRTVTWTAESGQGIAPDQFETFALSVGPLPEAGKQVAVPAAQKYSNGDVVKWDQKSVGKTEPEHPAPAFHVTAAADAHDPPSTTDTTARWLGGGGLAVGVVGVGVGAAGLRRRHVNDVAA
ncbi:YcnI family protein [Leekyejoonella antrihumi]|uniref:YcnI family protein n=1 Tax=Leekyejoonella antrihumi TaxID=1660198 RepID=A0A563DY27_9MICO|nr:YcnI family protein [Leekyejoonella antrihumi]TWP34574.1 YcnI family protein [Leekyejoonella antrihumi]